MDFLTLAAQRYSVRKFKSTPIEQDKIDKILEAAKLAPTACNFQPQRILVINYAMSLAKLKNCTKWHFDCPLAMLICYNKDECWTRRYDDTQSGTVDTSIVTTHMMLEAAELGIGSTWVMSYDPAKMREEFNIPENLADVALLVMGYPADDAEPNERHTQYKDLKETVIYNEF